MNICTYIFNEVNEKNVKLTFQFFVTMSISPNSGLVQRTIELNYANKKRASSLRWGAFNSLLFLLFAYDLSCKCPGYTTYLHYVELFLAALLGASALRHALRLLPRRAPPLALTPRQQRLLGLTDADLDSSFHVVNSSAHDSSDSGSQCNEEEAASLSPARAWSCSPRRSPHSSPHCSPRDAAPSVSPPPARLPHDRFIADRNSLNDYLKQYEERSGPAGAWRAAGAPGAPLTPPPYHLAAVDTESTALEEGSAQGSPLVWCRLDLDPQSLVQFNHNLRLWIQLTILERLVREMAAVDEALARHGLSDVRIGQVSVERLRGAAAAAGAAALPTLLLFLEPFADQSYVVRRIHELSQGGCLSNYKWNGGGAEWTEARPTDAELVVGLLAAYIDAQAPAAAGARPFSTAHVSAAPAPPPRGPDALALHRVSRTPPHYVLALADDTVEVCRGRNNLWHTLLLLLAAAAQRSPPALCRLHLGRHGLNMLWIIGR